MSQFSTRITAGGSHQFEFAVGSHPLYLAITASATPYDVDVETKGRDEPDSAYSRIQPFQALGVDTVTTTSEVTYETNRVEYWVRVTITNNSGGALDVQGVGRSGGQDDYYVKNGSTFTRPTIDADSVSTGVLNNTHYPEEYGAVGDGSTDDSSAIQSTIDNHSVVAFKPETTYWLAKGSDQDASQLTVPSNRLLIIPESTTLKRQDGTNRRILTNANPSTGDSRIFIMGGEFDGSHTGENHDNAGGNIHFHNVTDSLIWGVETHNAWMHGIEVSHSNRVYIDHVHSHNNGDDGISVSDGASTPFGENGDAVSENIYITNSYLPNNSPDGGFEVDDGPLSVYVINSTVEGATSGTHAGETDPAYVEFSRCDLDGFAAGLSSITHVRVFDCDFTVSGAVSTAGPEHFEWDQCRVQIGDGAEFRPNYGGLFEMNRCEIIGNGADRVLRLDGNDIIIRDCYVDAAGGGEGIMPYVESANILIANTRVVNATTGIYIYDPTGDITVDGCDAPDGIAVTPVDNPTADISIDGCTERTPLPSPADGTRVVVDGWSVNAGDPNSTGDWNGNGREGVTVRDTVNSTTYAYIDGGWIAV